MSEPTPEHAVCLDGDIDDTDGAVQVESTWSSSVPPTNVTEVKDFMVSREVAKPVSAIRTTLAGV